MFAMLMNLFSGQTLGGVLGKVFSFAAHSAEESPKKTAWTTVLGTIAPLLGLKPEWLDGLGATVVGLGQWLQAIASAMQ